jgi:hypothetical protein
VLSIHKTAICIVSVYIIVAIVWDVLLACCGKLGDNSFCEACREINAASDGLLALCLIALWIHIFLLPLLPAWWKYWYKPS